MGRVKVCVREEVRVCVYVTERGVPEDADYVLKLQLMGKWISVLDYSVEQGSHTVKSDYQRKLLQLTFEALSFKML